MSQILQWARLELDQRRLLGGGGHELDWIKSLVRQVLWGQRCTGNVLILKLHPLFIWNGNLPPWPAFSLAILQPIFTSSSSSQPVPLTLICSASISSVPIGSIVSWKFAEDDSGSAMRSGVRHTQVQIPIPALRLGGLKQRDLISLGLRFLSGKTGMVPVLPAPKFNEIKPVNYLESA